MPNRKTPEAGTPAQEDQQITSQEAFAIEHLSRKKKINRAIVAGVCAAEGWKSGKTVTEAEFLAAVKRFTSAPMSGAAKKEAAK